MVDDLAVKAGLPFPKGIKAKPGETVAFAYIVYRSRAHRDKVNAKVMKAVRSGGGRMKPVAHDHERE